MHVSDPGSVVMVRNGDSLVDGRASGIALDILKRDRATNLPIYRVRRMVMMMMAGAVVSKRSILGGLRVSKNILVMVMMCMCLGPLSPTPGCQSSGAIIIDLVLILELSPSPLGRLACGIWARLWGCRIHILTLGQGCVGEGRGSPRSYGSRHADDSISDTSKHSTEFALDARLSSGSGLL